MSTTIRYTSTDLASLPDDGRRYEIIDGDLFVSKQPRFQHQHACSRIIQFLNNWIDEGGSGRAVMAPGLIFTDDNDVVPDVVWLSEERLRAVLGPDGHFHGAPEIAIEALSPGPANSVRDRETKRELYGRRGVEEYWILDWTEKKVEVYRRRDETLQLIQTLRNDDELISPLLAGFRCPVVNLFDFPAP